MNIPANMLPETVTVKTVTGVTATGTVHSNPVTLRAAVDERTRMVRDMEGRETVSTATILTAPTTALTTGTQVTLPTGRVTRVIAVRHLNPPTHIPGWAHTEATCE